MSDVRSLLLANLEAAYQIRGWHGPNLRGALRGVTAEDALRRPADTRHNIWELTVHAAYWKYRVRRKLRGGAFFPIKGTNWFASPSRPDERTAEKSWRDVIRLLDDEHRLLRDAIASMTPAELRDPKTLRVAYGVAAHDVYHTGQIQLVKKLVRR